MGNRHGHGGGGRREQPAAAAAGWSNEMLHPILASTIDTRAGEHSASCKSRQGNVR